jgi:putative RNA 2'-phosphotransferase
MSKKSQIKVQNISRFMVYILGHRPDEFGLVPDQEGFVRMKDLIWAMHEEEGWRFVNQGHIREVLLSDHRRLFKTEDNRIRSLERNWQLDLEHPCQDLPKLLFHPVRPRAHSQALEKGLSAESGKKSIILTGNREMAIRIGLRRAPKPVILEVSVEQARISRVDFFTFGDLYLAAHIPHQSIVGPPAALEPEISRKKGKSEASPPAPDFQPGTFVLDAERDPSPWRRDKARGKKRRGWKEEVRNRRRKGSR